VEAGLVKGARHRAESARSFVNSLSRELIETVCSKKWEKCGKGEKEDYRLRLDILSRRLQLVYRLRLTAYRSPFTVRRLRELEMTFSHKASASQGAGATR
jgi:hypothetical protein